jgi:hypothetical protein
MNYYYGMQAFKKYGLVETARDKEMHEIMTLFPPTIENNLSEKKELLYADNSDQNLIDNLFK